MTLFKRLQATGDIFVEILGGVLAFWIGLWLILPWDTYAVSHQWSAAARVAPEFVWGLAFIIISGVKFAAIRSEDRTWRRRTSLLLALSYAFLALMFALGDARGIALPVWGTMACAHGWSWLRQGVQ